MVTAKILHRIEAGFLNHPVPLFQFEVNGISESEAISGTSKTAELGYLNPV